MDGTLRIQQSSVKTARHYMSHVVNLLRDRPLEEVARRPEVQEQYQRYLEDEKRMLKQIKEDASFLPQDTDRELVVIDQTRHNKKAFILKHLAYLLFPEAYGVICVQNAFHSNIKTNNLSFSMSLSLKMTNMTHNKNVGEIMRTLNIGDGHPGAAAGVVACAVKSEMLNKKKEILKNIYTLWRSQ